MHTDEESGATVVTGQRPAAGGGGAVGSWRGSPVSTRSPDRDSRDSRTAEIIGPVLAACRGRWPGRAAGSGLGGSGAALAGWREAETEYPAGRGGGEVKVSVARGRPAVAAPAGPVADEAVGDGRAARDRSGDRVPVGLGTVAGAAVDDVDEALYAERTIIRMLGMRRTVFVAPAGLVSVIQAACTDDVARRLRRQLEKDLVAGGVGGGDAAAWLRDVGESVLRALAARGGGASGAQLSEYEPRLRTQLIYAPDKSYGGAAYITSRVLVLLAAEGHLVRGHRRGGWSSGQFEWFPAASWLRPADGAEDAVPGRRPRRALTRTRRERSWRGGGCCLRARTGLRPAVVGEVDRRPDQGRAGRAAGGRGGPGRAPGVLLAGDEALATTRTPLPVAALLPALDPTPMGWQARDWFLGRAPGVAVRPDRQHRPDGLVGGPGRRGLGPAPRRARSPAGCWRTSARTRRRPSRPKRRGWRAGWARPG